MYISDFLNRFDDKCIAIVENKLEIAFGLFDKANKNDPNKETSDGKIFPKELLYSIRMTNNLNEFSPGATEGVQLAARCQHICRWEIPRDSFEMNRNGYLTWRRELAKFHAKNASEILAEVGYSTELIDNVAFLVQKKELKRSLNPKERPKRQQKLKESLLRRENQ